MTKPKILVWGCNNCRHAFRTRTSAPQSTCPRCDSARISSIPAASFNRRKGR